MFRAKGYSGLEPRAIRWPTFPHFLADGQFQPTNQPAKQASKQTSKQTANLPPNHQPTNQPTNYYLAYGHQQPTNHPYPLYLDIPLIHALHLFFIPPHSPPLAPRTQWSIGGLDRIQQHNFYMAGQLVNMTGLDPTMGSDFYT